MNTFIVLILSILISLQSLAEVKNESEIGITYVSGSSNLKTENFKHQTIFKINKNQIRFKGNYLSISSDSTRVELWKIGLRFDREVSQRLSWFIGKSLEGRDYKNNTDFGIKHAIPDTTMLGKITNEIGYRRVHEKSGTSDFLRLYSEIKNNVLSYWIEALVDREISWSFEPSLRLVLSESMAFRVSYLYKFKKESEADIVFKMALIATY